MQPEVRRSGTRVTIGLSLAVAGAVMLAMEPAQSAPPPVPGIVSRPDLVSAWRERFGFPTEQQVRARRRRHGDTIIVCEPRCPGDIDAAIHRAYLSAAEAGLNGMETVRAQNGWFLYYGGLQSYELRERRPMMKYSGMALAVGGAIVATLWSDVPVVRELVVSPANGSGLRVGSSISF